MARNRKPNDETPDQIKTRRLLEAVANHATRSEKTSWDRKRNNMERLVKQLRPLEDKILALRAEMEPIYEEIQTLRDVMVDECVHPFDMLVEDMSSGSVTCKFCNKVIRPIVDTDDRVLITSLEPIDDDDIETTQT